ncbi:MAG: TnsA endonuclease N-terminal domain-containing protein [Gammaproteobacteria bacterium]|uniref:TnsA endonuclease N-terminal domain-containing protein n=4 Tax=Pseudomonadaceae TaxID=135621 RepID=A0A9X1SRL5_9GAMM|nr:TnsA endonuclease N-terminal domain-containing protein [Gammaproteobacteria bacterium]MCD1610148.1 TnsA endonuclease N-terminal domain-containing protein [Stutzerimonas kunmingensis]
MTQQKIDKRIKSGRGTGVRESYQPWIKVWDIKSKGVSHLVPGVKYQRTHHLLSNAERDYHTILEQDSSIIDIREQFPLFTQAESQAIASSLNFPHPMYPGTRVPVVMTTDFLITFVDPAGEVRLAARSVKYRKELEEADLGVQNRIAEKLAIEERYWAIRKVEWKLVLHENLSPNRIANLGILRTYAIIHPSLPTEKNISNLLDFITKYKTDQIPLRVLLEKASREIFIDYMGVKRLFHHLLWVGGLEMDLSSRMISLSEPLCVWISQSSLAVPTPIEVTRHA